MTNKLARRPRKTRSSGGGSAKTHAAAPGKPWVTVHLDGLRVHFPQLDGTTIVILLNRETALELLVQLAFKLESLKLPSVQQVVVSKLVKWFMEDK